MTQLLMEHHISFSHKKLKKSNTNKDLAKTENNIDMLLAFGMKRITFLSCMIKNFQRIFLTEQYFRHVTKKNGFFIF